MKIEELWRALDADVPKGNAGKSGWLLRLARPASACPLFVAVELQTQRRAVFIRLARADVPARRYWPRCKGLEALAVEIDGSAHFGVALKEPRFADVFTALVEDLVRRVSEAAPGPEQGKTFLNQFTRWQKFLEATIEGLSPERQRGLWGELYFLRVCLLPAFGPSTAVGAWQGSQAAHQDFLMPGGAVEVKTTAGKVPHRFQVASERQLDERGLPALSVYHLALAVREGAGESLPEMIAALRKALADDAAATEEFEDSLLAAGYLDTHAAHYEGRGFTVREANIFTVRKGFPHLTETDLPDGVGEVCYIVDVEACRPFASEIDSLLATLGAAPRKGRKRR